MGKTWNDAAHAQLLLAIVHLVKLNAKQYEDLAKHLGEGLTGNALKCHIKALKRRTGTKADSDGSAPATPIKAAGPVANGKANGKATPKRKSKATGGRKRKASTPLSDPESTGSFQLEDSPPPKRVKTEQHGFDDEEDYDDGE